MADPDQAFEGRQSNKGTPRSLHLFKYLSLSVTIVRNHTKVVTISRPRKWLFLLVELCYLSENHHCLKSPFIIHSQKVGNRSTEIRSIFHKLHITENAMSVPNNLLYLQQVFERYTLKQWSQPFCNRGSVNASQFYMARECSCNSVSIGRIDQSNAQKVSGVITGIHFVISRNGVEDHCPKHAARLCLTLF